jgi:hypothetical protein
MAPVSRPRQIPPPRGSGIPHIAPHDLPRLINWLYLIDRDFLGDALWLRYDKLKQQAHHTHEILQRSCDGELAFPRPVPSAVHKEPRPHVLLSSKASRCDAKDHLTPLPHDIRLTILEFPLKPLPVSPPDQTEDESDDELQDWKDYILPRRRPPHPLNQLAGTSKAWRDLVEAFCGRQLIVLKQQIALGRQDEWVSWRELRTYTSCARMELVVRLSECCAFCGVETIMQSEKWLGLTCCAPCEDPSKAPEEAQRRAAEKAARKEQAERCRGILEYTF